MAIIPKTIDPLEEPRYTVTAPDGTLVADDVPEDLLPVQKVRPAPARTFTPPPAVDEGVEILPEEEEPRQLKPSPYDVNFVRNPSGGYDLLEEDGTPIRFNVPEQFVPKVLTEIGANKANPVVRPGEQPEPPVEEPTGSIEADYQRLISGPGFEQTPEPIIPEAEEPLTEGVRPAPARATVIGAQSPVPPIAPAGGVVPLEIQPPPPLPEQQPSLVPAAAEELGPVPAAPMAPPAQTPVGGPLALYNPSDITPPPPLSESGAALALNAPPQKSNLFELMRTDAPPKEVANRADAPLDLSGAKVIEPPAQQLPKWAQEGTKSETTGQPVDISQAQQLPKWAGVQEQPKPTVVSATAPPPGAVPIPGAEPAPGSKGVDVESMIVTDPRIGGGGGGRMVPEKWALKGGSLTQVKQRTDPELEALRGMKEEEMWAEKVRINEAAEAQAALHAEAAKKFALEKQKADEEVNRIKLEEIERKNAVQRRLNELDTRQRELDIATKQFNPNRKWEERSIFSKIFARLAMGLGAMGANITGGRNYAFEEIQKEINDDIEAQKLELGVKKQKVDIATNLVAQEQSNWRSPAAVDSAVRVMMNSATIAEANRMAALTNSQIVKNNAADYIAKMTQANLAEKEAIKAAELGVEQRVSALQPAHFEAGGGMSFNQLIDREAKRLRQHMEKEEAYAEAKKIVSARYNAYMAPKLYNNAVKEVLQESKATKKLLTPDEIKAEAERRTQAGMIDMATVFNAGLTGQVVADDGHGNKVTLTGKDAQKYIVDLAKMRARGEGYAAGRAKATLQVKTALALGNQAQLMQQIHAWYSATKKARDAYQKSPAAFAQAYLNPWSEEFRLLKEAKKATLETRAQAFVQRLAPGTNLGTEKVKELIGDPGWTSTFAGLEADYKTIMGRIIHNMVAENKKIGINVTRDEILAEYKDLIEGGTGVPFDPADVTGKKFTTEFPKDVPGALPIPSSSFKAE